MVIYGEGQKFHKCFQFACIILAVLWCLPEEKSLQNNITYIPTIHVENKL
jgi:hypothetical protein